MSVEKVLAIAGKPGLFELKVQTRAGFLAESLVDKKRITVGMRSNVSLLSEISIYTNSGEIKLFEVFARISKKENGKESISHKSENEELVSYFAQIVPDYDVDRVYMSDIKKVINWYNILQKAGLIAELAPVQTEAKTEENVEEKPKAKKTAKAKEATAEEKPKKTTKTKKEE